jgi:hypothetical protein
MPRKNKHKIFDTGKPAVFFGGDGKPARPECVGCAFAGYGGACTTSDGTCLITRPARKGDGNAANQRRADTAGEKR